jgi:membrane protein DedA with SNARE-associated domain
VGEERWNRANRAVTRHGPKAVLIGRFVGVLRAVVPAVVGDARMPYRRFLFWNALGAILWTPSIILAATTPEAHMTRSHPYSARSPWPWPHSPSSP